MTLGNTHGLPGIYTVQGPTPVNIQIITQPSFHFNTRTGLKDPNSRNSLGSSSNMSQTNPRINAVAKLAIGHRNQVSPFGISAVRPRNSIPQSYGRLSFAGRPTHLKTVPENGSPVDFERSDGMLEFTGIGSDASPNKESGINRPRIDSLRMSSGISLSDSETINIKSP